MDRSNVPPIPERSLDALLLDILNAPNSETLVLLAGEALHNTIYTQEDRRQVFRHLLGKGATLMVERMGYGKVF